MRIKSIQNFLVLACCSTVLIITILNAIWSYKTTNENISNLFDILLVDDANHIRIFLEKSIDDTKQINEIQSHLIVHAMNKSYSKKHPIEKIINHKKADLTWAENYTEDFESDIIFQLWTIKPQKLIIHSSYAPIEQIADFESGFDDVIYNDEKYRVYTQINTELNMIVQTAQKYEMRTELAWTLAKQRLYPIFIITPLLFLFIFFTIRFAANSIRHVTDDIKKRDPKNLSLLDIKNPPKEVLPLVEEINRLFTLINDSFAREQRFNSDAAHELKTPLAGIKIQAEVAIKALSEILQREVNNANVTNLQQIINNLSSITNGINRSDHIISQLLILSRLSIDQPLANVENCHLDKITRELIADLYNNAAAKNINISLDVKQKPSILAPSSKNLPVIKGNKILLTILIRNLIDNAIKYSGDNSKIKIKIITKDSEVIFIISDTGPGLPNDLKERIFDRFYRVPGTLASGSGLGLSIVKLIATLHNAKIKVLDNIKADHGLSFRIRFPR